MVAAAAVVAASYAFSALRGADAPPTSTALSPPGVVAPPAAAPATADDGAELDRVIGVLERRVEERDDASQAAFLGRLYLIRARRVGDVADYDRARAVLEEALGLAPQYLEAKELLAAARFALHDFRGSLDLAGEVLAEDPANLEMRAVVGDATLASGDVAGAAAIFDELAEALPGSPPVDVRLAQAAWFQGDMPRAVALAAAAKQRAAETGVTGPDLAWYHNFSADLAFDQGRLDVAEAGFRDALAADPASAVALAGLAQVNAARGDFDRAIELYREAAAGPADPAVLAALGDVYLAAGDPATAEEQYAAAERVARPRSAPGDVYSRTLAEFHADRDRDVAEALRLTAAELELRRDVHGWDAHAWALYRNGRYDEARDASDRAMLLGTPEPAFWYHAGLISAALGDTERAAGELDRALELNPHFDLLQAAEARGVLDELRAG